MKVRNGRIVRLAYRVTATDGRVVEQALSDDPLTVVQGSGQLSQRVEEQIEGLCAGDAITFQIQGRPSPYGASRQPLTVPHDRLPRDFVPRIGAAVGSGDPSNDHVLWVREIRDDHVVLDPRDRLDEASLTVRIWILDVVALS